MEECGKESKGEGEGEGIAELKDRDDIPLLLEGKKSSFKLVFIEL